MTAWAIIGFIFIVFPVKVIEHSAVWQWWPVQWLARTISKFDTWLGWLLPWSRPESVQLDPDGSVAVPYTLFFIIAATVLGAGIRIAKVTKYRFLKWLGWIYEKQTESWISVPTGGRTRVGDFIFLTLVQSPAVTIYQRRYVGLALLLMLAAESVGIWLWTTFDPWRSAYSVYLLPIAGVPLVLLVGIFSGAIGHTKLKHILVGGALVVAMVTVLVLIFSARATDVLPISGPDYGERFRKFVWLFGIPYLMLFSAHFLVFAWAAWFGGRHPWPWFTRHSYHLPATAPKPDQPTKSQQAQADRAWLARYERALANVKEAEQELELALEQGQAEHIIQKKRHLFELAQQELTREQRASWERDQGRDEVTQKGLGKTLVSGNIWLYLILTGFGVIVLPIKLLERWKGTKIVSTRSISPPASPSSALPKGWFVGLASIASLICIVSILLPWFSSSDTYDRVNTSPANSITPIIPQDSEFYEDSENPNKNGITFEGKILSKSGIPDTITIEVTVQNVASQPISNAVAYFQERFSGEIFEAKATDQEGRSELLIPTENSKQVAFYQITFFPPNPWNEESWTAITADEFLWFRMEPGETIGYWINEAKVGKDEIVLQETKDSAGNTQQTTTTPIPITVTPIMPAEATVDAKLPPGQFFYEVSTTPGDVSKNDLTINFNLVDLNGNPIPNAELYILDQRTSNSIKFSRTNEAGVASKVIGIQPEQGFSFTIHQITIYYSDDKYGGENFIVAAPRVHEWTTVEAGSVVEINFEINLPE